MKFVGVLEVTTFHKLKWGSFLWTTFEIFFLHLTYFFIHPIVRRKNRKYPLVNLHFHLLPFLAIYAIVFPFPLHGSSSSLHESLHLINPSLIILVATIIPLLSLWVSFNLSSSSWPPLSRSCCCEFLFHWIVPIQIDNPYRPYRFAIPIGHMDCQSIWTMQIASSYWQHKLPIYVAYTDCQSV